MAIQQNNSEQYYLGSWVGLPAKLINVNTPESLGAVFQIEDPHTGTIHFGKRLFENASIASNLSMQVCSFPPLQVIKDKRRLVKVLWMPQTYEFIDAIINRQAEAYVCTSLDKEKFIAFPLRVPKDTNLKSDSPPAFRLDWTPDGYPPIFAFHKEIYDEVLRVFSWSGNVVNPFIILDDRGSVIRCIQFRAK